MAMQLGGSGKGRGVKPDINVTPLVDIVLVLLIIFMVVIPNMQEGKPIEMVKVSMPDPSKSDEPEPITITLDANGVYTLGKNDVSHGELLAGIDLMHSNEPRRKVLLRADANLPYREVRDLVKELQDLGILNLSLAVGASRSWGDE